MLVMRTMFNNSDPRQTASPIFLLAAAIFCLWMSHATAAAQTHGGQAWVSRAAPGAILYGGGLTPSALRKGDTLQPGAAIHTRGTARPPIPLGEARQAV